MIQSIGNVSITYVTLFTNTIHKSYITVLIRTNKPNGWSAIAIPKDKTLSTAFKLT